MPGGCHPAARPQVTPPALLTDATLVPNLSTQRLVVANGARLRGLCVPLGPRLGLLTVNDRQEWNCLAAAVPSIGPEPDFRQGMLVGLVCWAGVPADGHWPIRLDGVRLCGDQGLVEGRFIGGTYFPDGIAYVETAYAQGVRDVVAVDIDGTVFHTSERR